MGGSNFWSSKNEFKHTMNTKVTKHLSIPENRINYCFHFLDEFSPEFVDYKKCYDKIAEWSDKLDTSESHF